MFLGCQREVCDTVFVIRVNLVDARLESTPSASVGGVFLWQLDANHFFQTKDETN